MAPLPVDDHGSCEDIGPFDGDSNRDRLIRLREDVAGASADCCAGLNIHRVVEYLAHRFCEVRLCDGGDDRRAFTRVDRTGGQGARGAHQIGQSADSRERLLDALEPANRNIELLTHCCIRANAARGELSGGEGPTRAARLIDRPRGFPSAFANPARPSRGHR